MPKVPVRKQTRRNIRRKRRPDQNTDPKENGDDCYEDEDMEVQSSDEDEKLEGFLKWAFDQGMVLNDKVVCTSKSVSANFGILAKENIKTGENIFVLPRPAALTPENCGIAEFIKQNEERLVSLSGWLPLILAIMYERLNPESNWKPYLDTFPNFDDMELPMFWPLSELDTELKGTGMVKSVAKDIKTMREEFDTFLLPLIDENPQIFKDPRCKDFKFVKEIAAFIMAYSFTDNITSRQLEEEDSDSEDEDSEPKKFPTIMVPMADLLNHVPNHNAELNLGESTFRMIATQDINQGEEVYNTYGRLSNYTLLLMYGFAVPSAENQYNTVDITWPLIKQACEETKWPDMESRCKLIQKMDHTDDSCICVHGEGITDDELILKVLRLDAAEIEAKLAEIKNRTSDDDDDDEEEDGWLSGDEDELELSTDDLRNSDDKLKEMLLRLAELRLSELPPESAESTDKKIMTKKQIFAAHVRDSQILLLKQLKQSVTWYK